MTDQEVPPFFGDPVTDTEIAAIRRLRSVFANRLYVTTETGNIRLHFAEMVSGEGLYHTAITLSVADAFNFGELMMKVAAVSMPPPDTGEAASSGPETGGEGSASGG